MNALSTSVELRGTAVGLITRLARRPRKRYSAAAACVHLACDQHGLDGEALVAQLGVEHHHAARYAFDLTSSRPTRREMRALVKRVEELLDLRKPLPADLASPIAIAARDLRSVFAGAVIAISAWLVIGSIVTSRNQMARGTSPLFAVAMLVTAMLTLALLEAAHIGAVALSTADVSTLKTTHPRVVQLHVHINTKQKLEEYLAARQFGVVLTVFVISYVTRIGNLRSFPGTSIGFPHVLQPLLAVGAPGALLVLVFAQVAPQLVTARRPAALMNTVPMAAAFHCTRAIGKLGMARPARWLVARSPAVERIASAPRERYQAETLDVNGFGVLAVNREVTAGPNETTAAYETTIAVHSPGRDQLFSTLATPASPTQLKIDAVVMRGDTSRPGVAQVAEETKVPGTDGLRLSLGAAAQLGAFEPDDVLAIKTTTVFNAILTEDFVIVDQPTKLVFMRVVLKHPPTPLPPATLTVTRGGEHLPDQIEAVTPVEALGDGSVQFATTIAYPEVGCTIRLRWSAPAEAPHAR